MSIRCGDDNETWIEWTFDIGKTSEKKTETCKLKRSKSIFDFNVSCTVERTTTESYGEIPVTHFELCLTLAQPSIEGRHENNELISNKEGERTLNYGDLQPFTVFCSVNGSKKKTMKKSPLSHEWKSPSTVDCARYGNMRTAVNCVFWIEFEDVGDGEVNLMKHLTEMYVQQNHCDVKFTFDGNKSIGGHVNILAARSPVFAAMFQHDMQEAKTGQVAIQDVQLDTFKEMLHFVYCGRIRTQLTEETALSLYVAADKYDMDDLKKVCSHFIVNCVQVNNALKLLVWANRQSAEKLKEHTLDFIAQHADEIFQSDEWEDVINIYPGLCLLVTRWMAETVAASNSKRKCRRLKL